MTVAFTDPRVHPASAPFYRMFPFEHMANQTEVKVDRVVEANGLKMEWLLEQIPTAVGAGGSLFIIFHGTDMGLSMPLAVGTSVQADVRVMEVLDGPQSDTDAAQICMFPDPGGAGAQRIRDLRAKIGRVKGLNLARVELRACNTGQSQAHMRTIKRFFNCRILGAPDMRDSYFFLDPGRATADAGIWQRWEQSHPRHRIYDVPANGRVGIAINETAHSAFQTFMIVNKDSAPGFWADVYLSFLHPHSAGMSRFPGHALYETAANFPLVFPGDDASYTRHIIHI